MQTTKLHTVNQKSKTAKWKNASLFLLSAAAFSSGFAIDNSIIDSPTIIASKGVSGISLSIQNADYNVVKLHDFNDVIVIDLGRIVLKGELYFIDWKKASHSNSESEAHLCVRESISNTNFIKNSVVHSTASKKSIKSSFIAESDIRYILISTASPLDDSIDVDKIATDYIHESSSKESPKKILITKKKTDGLSLKKENTSVCHFSIMCENMMLRETHEIEGVFHFVLQRNSEYFIQHFFSELLSTTMWKLAKKETTEIRPPPI